MTKPVIICCSGGLDSTALIHYYSSLGFDIKGIHFEYGQPAYDGECKAVSAISKYYGIHIESSKLRPTIHRRESGAFYGRNLLLILSAINSFEQHVGLISLGIHAGTPYYDCTTIFVAHTQVILDGYFNGTVVLDMPFLKYTKADIFEYCQDNNVPIELTYSCEVNGYSPCGACASCLDRQYYDSTK